MSCAWRSIDFSGEIARITVASMCHHLGTTSFVRVLDICELPASQNYANYSTGALPLRLLSSPAPSVPSTTRHTQMALNMHESDTQADSVPLDFSVDELVAGRCRAFNGQSGFFGFNLSAAVHVVNVTVSHIVQPSSTLAWFMAFEDLNTAPRRMQLWASVSKTTTRELGSIRSLFLPALRFNRGSRGHDFASHISDDHELIPIADMFYDIKMGQGTQTFYPRDIYAISKIKVQTLVLQVVDNWGRVDKTCLYGLEVYGHP